MPVGKEQNANEVSSGIVWQAIGGLVVLGLISLAFWVVQSDSHRRESALQTNPKPPSLSEQGESRAGVSPKTRFHPPSDVGFIGGHACAECHLEICESYSAHPMANSLRRIHATTEPGNMSREESRFGNGRSRYEIECLGNTMRHHELTVDSTSEVLFDEAVDIEYVVGSGRRARAYLHRRGELLFMSSLNWYSDDGTWNLAPGYQPDDPRRFDRRVRKDCAGCHAGRVNSAKRGTDQFGNPPFWEQAISCERCHGPGEDHVRFHNGLLESGGDPIVNPSGLDSERREAVCYQCHLQTVARVLRPGRSHLDFRPGDRLDDIWVFLDSGTAVDEDGRSHSINHVQQMRDSKCFRSSGGQMGCISCHDPHRVPTVEERAEFFRKKCVKCHAVEDCGQTTLARANASDSCVACHMPPSQTSNISHVSQTDHRILVDYRAETELPRKQGPETLRFFSEPADWTEAERARSIGLGLNQYFERQGLPTPVSISRSLQSVSDQFPGDGAILTVIGAIAANRGDLLEARLAFRNALADESARESALTGLVNVEFQLGDWQASIRAADQLLAIDTENARVIMMRGMALYEAGKVDEGIESVTKGLSLNPTVHEVRRWLIERFNSLGHTEKANEQSQLLTRLLSVQSNRSEVRKTKSE